MKRWENRNEMYKNLWDEKAMITCPSVFQLVNIANEARSGLM
jgi:hypothetical protein